jgi:hypothetical protein
MDDSEKLVEGTDYTKTVSLVSKKTENNKTTYTYKIVLTGIGDYTGTYTVTAETTTEDKIVLDLSAYSVSDKQYTGKQIKPKLTIKGVNGTTATLKEGTDYTVTYGKNINVGTLTGTITVKGIGKYTGETLIRFNIVPMKITSIAGGVSNQIYTGSEIKPFRNLTLSDGRVLNYGNDFTVSYKNNKNVGYASVTFKFKGNYTGTVTKSFKIYPQKQSIQKLTAKSKGFYIDYLAKNHATGYQIQYSTNSKFTNAKNVYVTKKSQDTKIVTGLKANTKYYVRVRTYTNVKNSSNKKVAFYGNWSATKTVTTKK